MATTKPGSEKRRNMLDVAEASNVARAALSEAWRHSLFRELLIENLTSERMRVVEPPEWYGSLNLLHGHGCSPIDLKYAVIYAYDNSIMNVSIIVTYEDVDSDETKQQAYDIHPPTELFRRTTKRAFREWAHKERLINLTRAAVTLAEIQRRARELIIEHSKKYGAPVATTELIEGITRLCIECGGGVEPTTSQREMALAIFNYMRHDYPQEGVDAVGKIIEMMCGGGVAGLREAIEIVDHLKLDPNFSGHHHDGFNMAQVAAIEAIRTRISQGGEG